MVKNYGPGVSRVVDAAQTQFTNVIFQQGRPPLDAEFSLLSDISQESLRSVVSQTTPSGWLGTGIQDSDSYVTRPTWSNWFRFGQQRTGEMKAIQWASVNGWLIPVTGTLTGTPPGAPNDADTWNRITLAPPPSNSGGGRIDVVFLEVWQARLPPSPSALNKPSSSGVYRYGNVEGGYSFLSDDMIDPSLGFETTQRVQIQYRIRVVTGLVGLQTFPDGFDPANVKGRGAAGSDTAHQFTNMRQALGDPGLWRAGDGTANSLGTVDGYTYAIPMCAVFRRNSVPWDGDPGQNLNGAFNRNPTSIDRTGWRNFTAVAVLAAPMSATQTTLTLSTVTNIALPLGTPATPVLIKVGDEVMSYPSITGVTATIIRGQLGSKAESHAPGTPVTLFPGRPDGLFADQIAKTDILDLRHMVNPSGFEYSSLLDQALDQLLRGELRANWKRSGAGPQGPFVLYQDKISASAAALGVSRLDSPDNIRQIWSDASCLQPIEFIANPPDRSGHAISAVWDLNLIATSTAVTDGKFSEGDIITVPISQFKDNTVPGSDGDQVQFPAIDAASQPVVKIRIAGDASDLAVGSAGFTVATPSGINSDLVITLGSAFTGGVQKALFITFHVQYGAGRGLARKPDSVHSVAFLNPTSGTLTRQQGIPANHVPMSAAWAPLWSKFRKGMFAGQLPTTAESYVDPGSKTLLLTPFRKVALPSSSFGTDAVNHFQAIKNDVIHGSGAADGLMPNPSDKWGPRTDPLDLFSGMYDTTATRKNTYIVLPRSLIPGWGAVHVPVRHTTDATFPEGINFGFLVTEGNLSTSEIRTLVPLPPARTFASFSTIELGTIASTRTPATFNVAFVDGGTSFAGARFFNDKRGLGRRGLELPPFYGIARLFAVYDADDYKTGTHAGSAYDPSTRSRTGSGAVNLLRQYFDGPVLWIEIDDDGDSTFILNADAIDITKSPHALTSFEAAHYVIESNIFGFDRGAFDLEQDCRIVLTKDRVPAQNATVNPNVPTGGVSLVVPAPSQNSDSIAVTYSRTPYQGDAWGSQLSQQDIGQSVGPLTSGVANSIGYTEIDEKSLTKPNQKVLQVLASKGFMTTLGTGRIAGDFSSTRGELDFRSAGYENAALYPPENPVSPRPTYSYGALSSADDHFALGTSYHGCTEQLPMGALFGSRDFRGESIDSGAGAVGLLFRDPSLGQLVNVARSSSLEQVALPVQTATPGSGGPGQVLVHVDGETGNMSVLTNYRTTRGGSAFVASGPFPGGELAGAFARLEPSVTSNATLCGIAYLVRNTVTAIGASEVSAGSELMLLIVTTAIRRHTTNTVPAFVLCGTQGSGEGFSAADLYRISGRPLTHDGARFNLDASNLSKIVLGHKVSLKPRIGD
jgi:hypothetical protein